MYKSDVKLMDWEADVKLFGGSLAAVFLFLCACPVSAHADESNRAKALVEECKSDRHACEEYLLGVWDAVLIHGDMAHASLFCTAVAPTGGELHAAFDKWVEENPDKMGMSRAVGAILALKHAYPCEKSAS
ncbi:Rap1a/Tai family immunity protein [Caulobacter sp. KR2-114]|uniref:Rap1a/Tai family immunity protein n=1 Tax=Caulobacter sp. KR2-114 TaxID=3400912 RepID=UPI003C01C6BA